MGAISSCGVGSVLTRITEFVVVRNLRVREVAWRRLEANGVVAERVVENASKWIILVQSPRARPVERLASGRWRARETSS